MIDTKLKKYLPKGWAKTISEEMDVSEQTVYRAYRSADLKNTIYQKIVKLAVDNKQREKELASKMKELIEE